MALSPKALRNFSLLQPGLGRLLSDLHGVSVAAGPTSGTPNTNLNVPHGLGATPATGWVESGNLYIVSYNATNVVVASAAASQSGSIRLVPAASDNYVGARKAVN